MSDKGFVKCNIIDGVGEIEFYHPKSNSLPSVLLNELSEGLQKFGNDTSVKVILLSSSGENTFCAGASFDELLNLSSEEEGALFFSGFAKVILSIKEARKFVVVKVQGKTVGGGLGIVCAADYSIAIESASVKLSELSIGIGPFVIGEVVKRKIGLSNFSHLAINSSEWKSAQWAVQKGLYSEVVEDVGMLGSRTKSLIGNLVNYSPEATIQIKNMFWERSEGLDDLMKQKAKQSGRLALSAFTRQILNRFKKK
tara:strand:- start:832 stop:1593 length:762 start_codon:yes stop_codon:yes gene_type:complete